VFDDRMWLFGGFHCDASGAFGRLADVWSSGDGLAWECALGEAPWPPRNLAGCVVLDGRIYLMGGFDGTSTLADIWASADGVRWDCLMEEAPWGARGAFGCAVHDGALWLLGGGHYHDRQRSHRDVWRSTDGADWEPATGDAGWAARRFHKAVAHNGALWVMGGATAGSANRNDVWVSADGRDWVCTDDPAPWAVRHEFGLLDMRESVWLLGGFSGEIAGNVIYCDVWQMEMGG